MPLDPALRDKILASVEAGFAEQIAFTQELIRFPLAARARSMPARISSSGR